MSVIQPKVRQTDKLLLTGIAWHADQNTLHTNVGMETLAKYAEVSKRTVMRRLPDLENAGFIATRNRRYGNVYVILIDDLNEMVVSDIKVSLSDNPTLSDILKRLSDIFTRVSDTKVSYEQGLTEQGLTEQGLNPPTPRSVSQDQNRYPKGKPNTKTAHHFDEFYAAYPVKKSKKKALEIWKRRNLDTLAPEIIENVRQRAASDDQWLRGYAPHPSTYLNQDLWEDEWESNENTGVKKSGLMQNLRNAQRAGDIRDDDGSPEPFRLEVIEGHRR